jgi:hypothetical protein
MDTPVSIWIEADLWAPDTWSPTDANSDVVVTFTDGSRWVASCFTYANIATLSATYQSSGELLHGRYFWATDMLLVQRLERSFLEELVRHLLQIGTFTSIFRRLPSEAEIPETAGDAVLLLPMLLVEHGDVLLFTNVRDAVRYIEPIDVINREYIGFDAHARRLAITLADGRPQIAVAGYHMYPEKLAAILRDYLEHVGMSRTTTQHLSLAQLIDACRPYAQTD